MVLAEHSKFLAAPIENRNQDVYLAGCAAVISFSSTIVASRGGGSVRRVLPAARGQPARWAQDPWIGASCRRSREDASAPPLSCTHNSTAQAENMPRVMKAHAPPRPSTPGVPDAAHLPHDPLAPASVYSGSPLPVLRLQYSASRSAGGRHRPTGWRPIRRSPLRTPARGSRADQQRQAPQWSKCAWLSTTASIADVEGMDPRCAPRRSAALDQAASSAPAPATRRWREPVTSAAAPKTPGASVGLQHARAPSRIGGHKGQDVVNCATPHGAALAGPSLGFADDHCGV
jgi:hypothetical protein